MTAPVPPQGRAQRVIAWLLAQPNAWHEPRTVPEIIAATEPGCSSQNMHGTVAALVGANKLKRAISKGGRPGLLPTPLALVDLRARPASPADAKRKRRRADGGTPQRKPSVAKPKPAARSPVPTAAPAQPATAPTTPAPRNRNALSALFTAVEDRRVDRDQLAADVAAFLAAGGVIEQLPHGACAQPLANLDHRAVNEASWRERQKTLQAA